MSEQPMHRLEGGCHCGNVHVIVELSNVPSHYGPRACDCEFCRKHGASYISDPLGSLRIEVKSAQFLRRYRQGSGVADCLLCSNCGVLVGVLYQEGGHLYATANSAALAGTEGFGQMKPVSPKLLVATEKISRWKQLWFSNVALVIHDA